MRKLLIAILIVLLIVLAYFSMFKGLSFGNFKILKVEEIIQANDNLTDKIEKLNILLKKSYPNKKEELSKSVKQLLTKKEEYFNIAKVSTEGEISKANTEETYLIEYLWTRVGRHATSKGVNLKMDVKSGEIGDNNIKNLAFEVKGQYIGIIQFISALENDDELNFKIEKFEMEETDFERESDEKKEERLTAKFYVRGVRIKSETVSTTVSESANTTNNTENNKSENTES